MAIFLGRFLSVIQYLQGLGRKPRKVFARRRYIVVLVLVLVLIKDTVTIKRILTQKVSVYPGFILMSVVIV